ncbi:MAG TPA: hypothetical protein HA247_01740 [Candidatus Thalassarchaeaceae archaeon]|nr:hypothetical protein [Euryarchaeota archaeon]DAC44583.1 MAG TPA: hypothetical protein D7H98_01770 [Candidatus Poseidoniales archaeon]HII89718.1 hypothetical protein [Candidatus Thalassarchaeaceae archaeon]
MPKEMGLHDHLAELRRSLIPPIVLASLIAVLSATSDNMVSWMEWWFDLYGDSSGTGLSVYAPHDWYVLKWSAAILLGITFTHPFLCFNLWKFVESGLIKAEKKVVSILFFGASFLLPVAVIAIVFASPYIASAAVSADQMLEVEAAIDSVAIASMAVSLSWIAVVLILLTGLLCVVRAIIPPGDARDWIRIRLHVIFAGILFLILSSGFEGMRIIIIIFIAVISEVISKLVPGKFEEPS